MGKLVVVEGLDGSGKATQVTMLAERLSGQGSNVRAVSFPDYGSPSSSLVKMYLAGDFGASPASVGAYAASSFYAVDRFASFSKDWRTFYADGGTVLADRYTTSNFIYQCAKLPLQKWDEFVEWLYDFEYCKLGIPCPDKVVYLDVEPEVSQLLLSERYAGSEEKKDIHERNLGYLMQCRTAALWCAEKFGWQVVCCSRNGAMRAREKIADEIYATVWEDL